MTKAGFLQKLSAALADLDTADRDSAIAFFTEQLDDRIEEGMTEAEAVESLGSFADIIDGIKTGTSSAEAAAETTTEAGKTNRPEPRSYTADRLPRNLILRESNCAVELHPSPDGRLRIDYEVTRWVNVTIDAVDDTLTYTAREIPHIFHWDIVGRKPVRVYLPTGANVAVNRVELRTANARIEAADVTVPTLKLHTANAHITVERITAPTLDVKTGNGKITAANITTNEATLHTGNASLSATHITANTLTLHTANGSVHSAHITANTLTAATANGKNTAEHITASTLKLTTSNGRINLQNTDAADLTLITSNGTITATLPGSIADYRITSSGGNLPKSKNSGTRSLFAKTSNGKIDIDFVGDR